MVAGTRTFTLEDTFLEPQVLDPPPTRHALFVALLLLAAILHLATAGWGDLYDGPEGQFAAGAREMLTSHQWLAPTNDDVPRLQTPPLVYWLIILSYKVFGVSAMAARFPIALAMVGSIALTFLIGERLAGYWRGFGAGLIHLCFAGTFLLGRAVTPEPVFSAFVAGAIFCAICGYQRRRFRRAWFAGFWLCTSLACLSKGLEAVFYLAAVCILLAIFFREARLRFRFLLHWSYLLLFLAIVAPWYIWAEKHFPGFFSRLWAWSNESELPGWQFIVLHLAWWFPAIFLILPGLCFAPRKIFRPQEMTFADALPLCWLGIAFLAVFIGDRQAHSTLAAMPPFALFAACAWERTGPPFRIVGIALALLAGGAVAAMVCFAPRPFYSITIGTIPGEESRYFNHMAPVALLALVVFSLPALFFVIKQRSEIALVLVLVSMVPIGLCLAESVSRMAPSFSLAGAARFLNPRLGEQGQVLYEGPLHRGNTLAFYLNRKFFLVNQEPDFFDRGPEAQAKYLDEGFVLEVWNRSVPIYFIIDETRVPHWQELITARVHIFHQVTTSGHHVVLSNQL